MRAEQADWTRQHHVELQKTRPRQDAWSTTDVTQAISMSTPHICGTTDLCASCQSCFQPADKRWSPLNIFSGPREPRLKLPRSTRSHHVSWRGLSPRVSMRGIEVEDVDPKGRASGSQLAEAAADPSLEFLRDPGALNLASFVLWLSLESCAVLFFPGEEKVTGSV